MVAVVSGNGLGLFNTSLTQLGSGLGGSGALGQGRESQLVNIATGGLILQDQEESLSVRGLNATFLRTYNSRGTVTGAGQDGFVTGYERSVALTGTLNAAGSTMALNTGDGQSVVFTYTSANLYTSTVGDGAHDTLSWNSTARTWTLVEGSSRREETYADHADGVLLGRLTRIRDLSSDGTTPAQFDVIYDAYNRVSEVRSVDGAGASADAIVFGYNGTTTQLTAVATREGGQLRSQLWYEYDAQGRLSAVITDLTPSIESSVDAIRFGDNLWNATASANDGKLFRTSYTYVLTSASDLRIASVTQGDGTVSSYTYEADGAGGYRVKTATLGDTNSNDADGVGETVTFTYSSNSTDVADSLGRVRTYKYDANKQLTEVHAPAIDGLRDVTTYSYDGSGNVMQVKTVRGADVLSQMDYLYDANGNQTRQWDALGNTVQRWFTAANQVSAENAYTVANPDHAAPPTGALTSRYIYDASNRLRFTWSALGEVTEFTYATSGNGIGQRASARTYLGATYSGTFDEASMAAWATSTQKANSSLVEYSYDIKGRLSQATAYATVNASGVGVLDAATDLTRYNYDAQGLLLQQLTVRGIGRTLTGAAPAGSEVIDYVYDGLGRLLSVLKRDASTLATAPNAQTDPTGYAAWDAATQLTTYAYSDSGKQIVITLDTVNTDVVRSRIQTQTYNAAHRLITLADAGTTAGATTTRTSRCYYDAAGQLRATEDATVGRHYTFYDAKGLVSGEVDATGALTEYVRDGAGRVVDTIGYTARVNTSAWVSGNAVVPTDFGAIRPTWSTTFDSLPVSGLSTTHVDNASFANVIQLVGGRLSFTTQYNATTISPNVNRTPTHALTENTSYRGEVSTGASQNNTYMLFAVQNTLAQPAFRRVGAYFRNGNLYLNTHINGVSSNTLIGATQANTTYVVEVRTRDGAIEYSVYVKGQDPSTGWTFSVDADASEWGAARLVVSGFADPAQTGGDALYLDNLGEADLGVRHSTRSYDEAGRLATVTDAAGTVTTYSYDAAHRLLQTRTTDALGTAATARATRFFYDNANRQIATLDAAGYLTETVYDLGGRAVKTVRYATPCTPANWASGTLAVLRPAANAGDQTTRYFYDGRGRQAGVLSAEGHLTEYVYDEASNLRAEKAYAKSLASFIGGSETLAFLRTEATVTPPVPTEPVRLTQRAFNGLGQLITEVNAEGAVTRYSYDESGRLVRTQAAYNTSEVRENFARYDVFGNLIGELSGVQAAAATASANLGGKAPNDPTLTEAQLNAAYSAFGVTHSHDLVGRRLESTDAQGNKTWYFYDSLGRQTHVVRGVAEDNNGVTSVANAYGEVIETRYSAFGEVVDRITYTGRITAGSRANVQSAIGVLAFAAATDSRRQFAYDTRGLLSRMIDAQGTVSSHSYTAFGQLEFERRALGAGAGIALTIKHSYDNRGLETSRIDAQGDAGVQRSVSQSYDAFGRVIGSIDGRGAATSYGYDRLGRQITRSQNVTVEGVLRAETWTSSYDAYGRVLSQTDALGRTTTYLHSDSARSLTITTPELVTMVTVHNLHGQTVTVTDAKGNVTTYAYDKNGALTSTQQPGITGANTAVYDVRGLLADSIDATGRKVSYVYDAVGRVLQRIEDPAGLALTTRYRYDGQGRQVSVTDASGRVSSQQYDREGRVTAVTVDPTGLNLTTNYTYDAAGRQVTVTDASGNSVQYVHDSLGRRTSETVAPGTLDLITRYLYDGNDNVVQRTDAEGAISRFVYDEANRLTHAIDALGGVTKNSYDAAGRLVATRQYAAAITVSDLSSTSAVAVATIKARVDAIFNDALDALGYRVYDKDGRLRFTVDGLGNVSEQRFDNVDRVVQTLAYVAPITLSAADKAAILNGSITLATASAWVSAQEAAANVQWTVYDAAGRARYSVDALGNVQEGYYDAANRQVGTRHYANTIVVDATLKAKLNAGTALLTDLAAKIVADDLRDTRNYQLIDTAGRAHYTVDALGNVSEQILDKAGRVVGTRAYANAIVVDATLLAKLKAGTALLADISSKLSADAAHDAQSYRVYDGAGRLRFSFDGLGNASELRYDAGNRVAQSLGYVTPVTLSAADKTALLAGTFTVATAAGRVSAQESTAHVQSTVYDDAGRARYTIDALGGVQEAYYDAASRLVGTRAYANAISIDATLSADLKAGTATEAELIAKISADDARDARSYQVLDAAGRARFSIDALGDIVEMRYDAAGRVTQQLAYATALPGSVNADVLGQIIGSVTGLGIGFLLDSAATQQAFQTDQDPSAVAERHQMDHLLEVAMDRLDGRERTVMELHYRQHVPFVEIADLLGVTKGRVSQIHRSAIERMRSQIHSPRTEAL